MNEVCFNIPDAFWHKKRHIVNLPYDFNRKNIPTELADSKIMICLYMIQANQLMDFCSTFSNTFGRKRSTLLI